MGRSWILIGFTIQATAMSIHFAATNQVAPAGWPSAALVALGIFVAATALFLQLPPHEPPRPHPLGLEEQS